MPSKNNTLEYQEKLLGLLVKDYKLMVKVFDKLVPTDFDTIYAPIYCTMLELHNEDKKWDNAILSEHVEEQEKELAFSIGDLAGNVDLLDDYVKKIRDASVRRKVREVYFDAWFGIDEQDTEGMILHTARTTEKLFEHIEVKDGSTDSAYNYAMEVQAGKIDGFIPTGFTSLDDYAPGPDEFVLVGARPSTGKTALALAIAENLAGRGMPVLFVSIEMGFRSITWRRWCALAQIPYQKLRRKNGLSSDELAELKHVRKMATARPLHVVCSASTTTQVVGAIKKYFQKYKVRCVFIDHLHLLTHPNKENNELSLRESLKMFANMTKQMGIPIYMLAQLNRGAGEYWSGGDNDGMLKEPRESDLRGSGAAEEDADLVWLLHRPDKHQYDSERRLHIIIPKNRNGSTGRVVLGYNYQVGHFWDLPETYKF